MNRKVHWTVSPGGVSIKKDGAVWIPMRQYLMDPNPNPIPDLGV